MEHDEPMRIVLLGKTGAGKSSLANVIYGEKGVFKESAAATSETKECSAKDKRVNGRLIRLIDTPGLFDTDLNTTELSQDILKCIEECAPGPHAFLLVLKVERYTVQEQAVVQAILQHFSAEALNYTTVVFTHGDQLDEGQKIEDWYKENKALRSLVQKCGGRCHVFDNKYWNNSHDSYRNNQVQVTALLRTIEQSVTEKNGKHYTNASLAFVINNINKIRLSLKYTAKVLLGALLGVTEEFKGLFENRPTPEEETSRSQHVQEMETLRIILLGKTQAGKSSLGNTIFGEEIFKTKKSPNSVMADCTSYSKEINGKSVRLFDTPGVFDTDPSSTDLGTKFYNCVKDCAPGPHAFLLVLKVERYTVHEEAVVDTILKYFSEEALKYTTVVFTHGDQLNEGQNIEDWYKKNKALRSLVQKCGGRCHVFDNKYWNDSHDSYRNNQVQVTALLRTIEETVEKNGGGCYTVEMLQIINKLRPLFSRILDFFSFR